MEDNIIVGLVDICKIFHKHSVQYLIVGGTAVALHGYSRVTMMSDGKPAEKHDLDIWYNPTYSNYFNLLNALTEIGLDVSDFKTETAPNPKKSFLKLETDNFTLDFLPNLKVLKTFRSSFKEKEIVCFGDVEIWFINFDDLVIDKVENARPKDLIDIEQLKIRRNKSL